MEPDVTIEPATEHDVETITDQWVELARGQRAYGSDVLAEANRVTMRELLATYRFTDGLLVARVDGTLVGFAACSFEQGSLQLETVRGILSNVYVEPAYRNRGIGTALLHAVEETLAAQGADVVALEAMAENEAARRFYRNAGYEPYRVAMKRPLRSRTENDTHSKEDA